MVRRLEAYARSLLFAIMLATSMLALKYSTTGAVVVARNVAPLFALIMESIGKEKVLIDVWTILALCTR